MGRIDQLNAFGQISFWKIVFHDFKGLLLIFYHEFWFDFSTHRYEAMLYLGFLIPLAHFSFIKNF